MDYFNVEFSQNDSSIETTIRKCGLGLHQTLSDRDFYIAFFKPSDEKDPTTFENSEFSTKNAGDLSSRSSEKPVGIVCKESDTEQLDGPCSNRTYEDDENCITIWYDLKDIRTSVNNFLKETKLPEFFFWKTILKRRLNLSYDLPSEEFGTYYKKIEVGSPFSTIRVNDRVSKKNQKYILKNSYFKHNPDPVSDPDPDMVVIQDDPVEKLMSAMETFFKEVAQKHK